MNETAPYEHVYGWISEPKGRGTASLLSSCLLTIFLCTWSALHINIPSSKSTLSERFFYKLRLTLVAIIAPEFIVGVALGEFFSVRDLMRLSRHWPENISKVRLNKILNYVMVLY